MAIFPVSKRIISADPRIFDMLVDCFGAVKDITNDIDRSFQTSMLQMHIPGFKENEPVIITLYSPGGDECPQIHSIERFVPTEYDLQIFAEYYNR